MNPEDRARHYWQSEKGDQAMPSIEELRTKADKFHTKIKRRNMIEYVAGITAVLWFGWIAVMGPLPWTPPEIPAAIVRLGAALLGCGVIVVLWQLHLRTNPLSPPVDGGVQSVLDYQRQELVRQRDAFSYYFFWYLLPFVPGLVVMLWVPLALSPTIGEPEWFTVLAKTCIVPAFFALALWLGKRATRKFQAEIDAIDDLREA